MNKSIKPWVFDPIKEKLIRFKDYKNIAFTVIVGETYSVGIAERGTVGYTPTRIPIPELQYPDAKDIVDELNEQILGIDCRESAIIVLGTMR